MPVWDLVATLKVALRYALILGFFLFLAGFASLLGDAITSLWNLINTGVNDFQSLFTSSSGESVSCFYHYVHLLGIDTAVTSFFVSVVGLGTIWGSVVMSILSFRVGIFGKNLLLEGAK